MENIANIEKDPEIVRVNGTLESMAAEVHAVVVKNPADESRAIDMTKEVKKIREVFEERETFYVAGPKAFIKTIQGIFKPKKEALSKLEADLKSKVIAYRNEVEEQERREIAKLEEKRRRDAERAEAKGKPAPIAPPPPVMTHASTGRGETGAASFRRIKKWEITDLAAVPREYLMPDSTKIGKVVSAGIDIPGVRTWEEKVMAVR